MQKSEHFSLNLYDPADSFLRTDFNADTQIIDSTLWNLTQDLSPVKNIQMACGKYTGNAIGNPMSGTIQQIQLGFRPSLVLIRKDVNGSNNTNTLAGYSALVLDGDPLMYSSVTQCEITDYGFYVTLGIINSNYVSPILNRSDTKYLYVAVKFPSR